MLRKLWLSTVGKSYLRFCVKTLSGLQLKKEIKEEAINSEKTTIKLTIWKVAAISGRISRLSESQQ